MISEVAPVDSCRDSTRCRAGRSVLISDLIYPGVELVVEAAFESVSLSKLAHKISTSQLLEGTTLTPETPYPHATPAPPDSADSQPPRASRSSPRGRACRARRCRSRP